MLARLQRGHRDFTVGAVGGADMHHVDAAVLKQLPIVLVHLGPRRAKFLGRLFGPLHDDVAERHHVGLVRLRPQGGHVLAVGDAAAADDADAKFFHVRYLL